MDMRRFDPDTFVVQAADDLANTHLIAYAEPAIYGLQLAFPEADEDRYRVDLVRTSQDVYGAELIQRLPLADYASQMEAEAHLEVAAIDLWEQGPAALGASRQAVTDQLANYAAGYLPLLSPPDAVLRDEPTALALLVIGNPGAGIQEVILGRGLPPQAAGQMVADMEDAQAVAGTAHLLAIAHAQAVTLGTLSPEQPLFHSGWHTPSFYLDQRELLEQQATWISPVVPTADPLLAEATRLGAVIESLDFEEPYPMKTSLQAERYTWAVELNEHVTSLPPHVAAEYQAPAELPGSAPIRLRLPDDPSPYSFEVSLPDEQGDVTLAAVKTFESEILHKPVTETAVLKTYQADDYEAETSYLNPRSEALADARALVLEWGRHDLDQAMGSAFKLAQAHGFAGDTLFEHGPPDTFTLPADARSVEDIQAERAWERAAETFGTQVPLPETSVYARPVGQYGVDTEIAPGQFYGIAVRETVLDDSPTPLYIVDGVKAWLDADTHTPQTETVSLDIHLQRQRALEVVDEIADLPDVPARLARMTTLANDLADDAVGLTDIPLQTGQTFAENAGLTLRETGLFEAGPPEPVPVLEGDTLPLLSVPEAPVQPWHDQEHSRVLADSAYDAPLADGQAYEFRARRLPALEDEVARYGVDALAVETVKHWEGDGEKHQQPVTLGIYYDRDEARQEVDTYADLAEREGIQVAMSRAAMLADVQNSPVMVEKAAELDLHLNPDVRYGAMFNQGPADPFLSEREIDEASRQYAADHPAHHQLSLEVVPVQTPGGETLGHSVLAVDARWSQDEPSRDLEDAVGVSAREIAQFRQAGEADDYALHLSEYMGKRDLDPSGTDISPALNFVKTVQAVNGLGDREHWLEPSAGADLARGQWVLHHEAADFHPLSPLPERPIYSTAPVDLDL